MARFVDKGEIEQLSIVDFLARLGYRHRYKSGAEYFYHSMLRDDDVHSPSFTVNDAKGTWMDRGNAAPDKRGGGIVQLATALWPNLSFVETLNEISRIATGSIYLPTQVYEPHIRDEPEPNQEYRYALVAVKPHASYEPISRYIESRGLTEAASGSLFEVYFRDRKKPELEMPYFGVGWLNEHGNYEFSTTYGFKSSIGQKGISVIPRNPDKVQVFEGYFDYLSRFRIYPEPEGDPTVMILNAVSMLPFALERLKRFSSVDIYMDLDGPGIKCTQALMAAIPYAIDRSIEYEGFKDYNEKLQHLIRNENKRLAKYSADRIGR